MQAMDVCDMLEPVGWVRHTAIAADICEVGDLA
jgi:hypothetical protein